MFEKRNLIYPGINGLKRGKPVTTLTGEDSTPLLEGLWIGLSGPGTYVKTFLDGVD